MRSSQRNDFVLTDYARTLIRFKARQLCRLHGFSRSDEEERQDHRGEGGVWSQVHRRGLSLGKVEGGV